MSGWYGRCQRRKGSDPVPISGIHHVDGEYLELGVPIPFPPEEDHDEPGYWAQFLFDPDGMRVEVAHWENGQA